MKKLTLNLLLVAGIAALLIGGCSDVKQHPTSKSMSSAHCTITWPKHGRYIPSMAYSIVVTLSGENGYSDTQIVNYPSSGTTSDVLFPQVPVGAIDVTATAYPDFNGTGVAQAKGYASAVAEDATPLYIPLTMDATIASLILYADTTVVTVGDTLQINADAQDSAGESIVYNPDTLEWSSLNPDIAGVNNAGVVTGNSAGDCTIQAYDMETGITGYLHLQVVKGTVDTTVGVH